MEASRPQVRGASVVLLQREVPEFVNEAVAEAAARAKITVIQDCGGEDRGIADAQLKRCAYVAPNLSELARLAGADLGRDAADADVDAACRVLLKRGASKVLATLGARGCRLVTARGVAAAPAVPGVDAVDETAAGDAFRAAFAVALAEGEDPGGNYTSRCPEDAFSVLLNNLGPRRLCAQRGAGVFPRRPSRRCIPQARTRRPR